FEMYFGRAVDLPVSVHEVAQLPLGLLELPLRICQPGLDEFPLCTRLCLLLAAVEVIDQLEEPPVECNSEFRPRSNRLERQQPGCDIDRNAHILHQSSDRRTQPGLGRVAIQIVQLQDGSLDGVSGLRSGEAVPRLRGLAQQLPRPKELRVEGRTRAPLCRPYDETELLRDPRKPRSRSRTARRALERETRGRRELVRTQQDGKHRRDGHEEERRSERDPTPPQQHVEQCDEGY